jgi:spoIIIJ-associated protein
MTDAATLRVETTGETVGEAKWAALRELERLAPTLDKSAVRFQVVSEGERGLLGVGFAPARVVATVEAAQVAADDVGVPESEAAAEARELVDRVLHSLGVSARVEVREDDDSVTVACLGHDLGLLIGRHGQTIDAIQYLANAAAARAHREARKEVVVDAAGYRARRRSILDELALRAAERARGLGEAVELEPMTAVERKVVHVRLKEEPGVRTASEGAEPNRYVVVLPE